MTPEEMKTLIFVLMGCVATVLYLKSGLFLCLETGGHNIWGIIGFDAAGAEWRVAWRSIEMIGVKFAL